MKGAVISKDGVYRYQLSRVWDDKGPSVLFILHNPSTADDKEDDPTIRRCIGFAKSWGFGSMRVGNVFAFRSTDPQKVHLFQDPVGRDNQAHLIKMSREADLVVCGWGHGLGIPRSIKSLGVDLHYLELQKTGTPKHPLYLKGNLKPTLIE